MCPASIPLLSSLLFLSGLLLLLGSFLHPCELHPLYLEHQVLHNKLRCRALSYLLWMALHTFTSLP